MLFNSITFIAIFLPSVLVGYYSLRAISPGRASLAWLTLASLFFYAWWNPKYLILLLLSVTTNYFLGLSLASIKYRKTLLAIGVSANLLVIAVYKYLGFISGTLSQVSGLDIPVINFLLPLAISFFTFQQIAYLVDTYRTGRAEKSFDQYVLFVSFFPQLIAGPIVHHKQVASQFSSLHFRSIPLDQINVGIVLFSIGLAKKVLIADNLAPFASPVFSAADAGDSLTFLEAWGGLLAYTFQLYFDFSGYADMAVGLAKLFGINLPVNFNSPYKATSIIDFWRRWHITLSHFLRDYLYIPLGGNRRGSKSINLLATMLLGGLWHGAGWNFVIWGGLHGAYLILNHQWIYLKLLLRDTVRPIYSRYAGSTMTTNSDETIMSDLETDAQRSDSWYRVFMARVLIPAPGMTLTFLAVVVAWAFFRAESLEGAVGILTGIIGLNGLEIPKQIFGLAPSLLASIGEPISDTAIGSFPHVKGFALIGAASALAFFTPNSNEISRWVTHPAVATPSLRVHRFGVNFVMFASGIILLFSLKVISFSPDSEFLYFNF